MIKESCKIKNCFLSKKRKKYQSIKEPQIIDQKITSFFNNKKVSIINPKTKEFDLSSKAKYYIDQIHKQKQIKREKRQISILDSFSLREKFHHLIHRELELPNKYKALLNSFIQIDQEIFNGNKDFNLYNKNELEQILFLLPNCYIINNNTITINNEFTDEVNPIHLFEKRKILLKNKLLELVNKQHDEFLKKYNIKAKFSPFVSKTWHSLFNVESCDDIEKKKINL